MTRDFQQCGVCDQQRLRSACAYAQSDQSLCKSLEYSMIVKLLTEHHLELVSKLKRRLQRLVRVYICQNVKLLEISCRGSYTFSTNLLFNIINMIPFQLCKTKQASIPTSCVSRTHNINHTISYNVIHSYAAN